MATHNLFRGGLSTRANGWSFAMYPSTDVDPNGFMEGAAHKTPVDYSLTWGLAPGNQCHEAPQRSGFMAQHAYFRDLAVPLAVGDVINAVIMPRFSSEKLTAKRASGMAKIGISFPSLSSPSSWP